MIFVSVYIPFLTELQHVINMIGEKKVLVFGSGLMASSLVRQLLKRPENKVHLASNIVQDAKKISESFGLQRCSFSSVDVASSEQVSQLVKGSDIVISYVPAFLHIHIAKVCLELGKNLVTASYVSPAMMELDVEAKAKNLIFLNELGLDPGIDHLATMKIVEETQKQKGKILEYESWCGGLPSPQFCDNPLGYKFSWSPIGAFHSLKNEACYIQNNEKITIDGKKLQYSCSEVRLNQALTLEGYPNRDSLKYKELYNLKDAYKVLRGTLRYQGFCTIINAFKELFLLEQEPIKEETWLEYITQVLKQQEGNSIQDKIRQRCLQKIENYENYTEDKKNKLFVEIIKGFKFFGLLDKETKVESNEKTKLQNLISLLEKKLSLKKGQADMIAMQHIFLIEDSKGKKTKKKSSLIQIGEKNGYSAMSLTVSTPTAIGAQLILDGKIQERGVIIPKYPDIYLPILEELEKNGIKLVETQEEL